MSIYPKTFLRFSLYKNLRKKKKAQRSLGWAYFFPEISPGLKIISSRA
jgi:hypothetical protein